MKSTTQYGYAPGPIKGTLVNASESSIHMSQSEVEATLRLLYNTTLGSYDEPDMEAFLKLERALEDCYRIAHCDPTLTDWNIVELVCLNDK